eukprot:15350312-Ditylum_brightwellii.AAC.1
MERTKILANVGTACDATDNPSTVQPSIAPSRAPIILPLHIQALPILHKGQDSQVPCSAVVLLHILTIWHKSTSIKNYSSSNKEYEQSDDADHDSDLEELTSDSGEEGLEDPNCLKLPHCLVKEPVKGKNNFSIKDVYEEEAE